MLVLGFGFRLCGFDNAGPWAGAAGVAMGFALLLPLYLYAGLGAGDLKLLAASGMMLGPVWVAKAAACSAVLGGSGALLTLWVLHLRRAASLRGGAPVESGGALSHWALWQAHRKRRMPMAPAVATGVLIAILQSDDFASLFQVRQWIGLFRCTL